MPWPYPFQPNSTVEILTKTRFITYNPQSMLDNTTKGFTFRPYHMRTQLAALKPSFAGMQESRDEAFQRRIGLCFSSGSLKGVLGCQFLINADAQHLPGKKPILFKHTSVAHSDPRLLMVIMDNGYHSGTYIVGHAPQNTAPLAVRRAWWAQLRQLVAKASSDVTLFIDAYGQLGSIVDQYVGPGGFPQQQDHNGSALHRLLIDFDLFVPSTFVEIHADHATHTNNRIDYIVVPKTWKIKVALCTTIRDFDPCVAKEDHWPSVLELETGRDNKSFKKDKDFILMSLKQNTQWH